MQPMTSERCASFSFRRRCKSAGCTSTFAVSPEERSGTGVGFLHCWQGRVIPAAAASTTSGELQCMQVKVISPGVALICMPFHVKQMTCHSVVPQSRGEGGHPALARHCLRKGNQVRHNISIGRCRSYISGSISSSPLYAGPGIWIAK